MGWFWLGLFGCVEIVHEENLPPSTPEISIDPSQPSSWDMIDVHIDLEATDPNGDKIRYRYAWYRNGELTDWELDTLPFLKTNAGEWWTVRVFAQDLCWCKPLEGPAAELSFWIGNGAPVVLSVEIIPENPKTTDDLQVSVEWMDLEGDELEFLYLWSRNNLPSICCVDTIDADVTKKKDKWSVMVVPKDGHQLGLPASTLVSIANSEPQIDMAEFSSLSASRSNPPMVEAELSDVDGDSWQLDCSWLVNGDLAQVGSDVQLSNDRFAKGDWVLVLLTPYDGFVAGEKVVLGPIKIDNSLPTITAPYLEPEVPVSGEDIFCGATGWFDADDDLEDYIVAWFVDDALVGVEPILSGEFLLSGTNVRCEISPFDGEGAGETVEIVATVVSDLSR